MKTSVVVLANELVAPLLLQIAFRFFSLFFMVWCLLVNEGLVHTIRTELERVLGAMVTYGAEKSCFDERFYDIFMSKH